MLILTERWVFLFFTKSTPTPPGRARSAVVTGACSPTVIWMRCLGTVFSSILARSVAGLLLA